MKTIPLRTCMLLVPALSLVLGLTACATGVGNKARTSRETTIWQSRDQFVRIVPRETIANDPAPSNDHPVRIDIAALRRTLSRPTVTNPETGKPVTLFSDTERGLLAEHISAGLERCTGEEEIVFAVYGYHPTLMGLAREERVTTGRVFHRGGELNLILGMVHQKVNSKDDRRLAPFIPGSRLSPARLDGTVTPGSTASARPLKRADWLVFSISDEPATEPSGETARPDATTPSAVDRTGEKSIEERLQRLKSLRDKDLISDEEYRGKRRRILDEL